MTYLPNSIERCTPIVGFDPYAFIMDRPSNLRINKMQSPYDKDYFTAEPEKTDDKTSKNPDETKKKGALGKILKIVLGIAAIGIGIFGLTRCHARASAAGSAAGGGGFGACLRNLGTCALAAIGNGVNFAARQLTRFANFIQSKIVPPTPPAP